MFHEFDLTIPANTLKASPAELAAVMGTGIIKGVEVQIPFGCRGLVFTVALRGLNQVWPSNPDASIKGDGSPVRWGESYDLTEPPHVITLRGWSPSTSFQHIITWRFELAPAPEREPVTPGITSKLRRLLTG